MTPAIVLAATMTIVALGDSTTKGTPGPTSYADRMREARPGWTIFARGVDGERSDQIRARFERDVEAAKPDYVIILAGVNDAYQGRPTESTKLDLMWMYRRAKAIGAVPVAATILPFSAATPDQSLRIERLNAWIRGAASRERIPFCDTARAAADPKDPRKLKGSPDGLHPDEKTYREVGDALVRTLTEARRSKR
jgi:acyl-CoA thioesterase-1